jgi:probable HAF family extracellular repeat protein
MNFDLDRVIDKGRNRAQNGVRALATALVVGFSALAAASQTYDLTNLSLAGLETRVDGIAPNGMAFGYSSTGSAFHAFVATHAGIVDIGTLGGPIAEATAGNGLGQVVGTSYLSSTYSEGYHAFLWTSTGGMVDISTLDGRNYNPFAINDSGQVIGAYQPTNNGNEVHGFYWSGADGMIDLGTLGGDMSWPLAINPSGQIVGFSRVSPDSSVYHAFSWTKAGGMVDLGALPGGSYSQAYRLNAPGQVMGLSYLDDNTHRAFSWTKTGGMVDLGTPTGTVSQPFWILDSGQIFGVSYVFSGGGPFHSWMWTPATGMVDLGTLGGEAVATGVNASGEAAGYSSILSDPTQYQRHAFKWTSGGGMVDIGTLGGKVSMARAINKLGQIVGISWMNDDVTTHAFLYDGTSLEDLNDLVVGKPAGMELQEPWMLSDSGAMVMLTNVGSVLLSPSSPSTAAPVIGPISANDPVAIGATLSTSASFTDVNTSDTHSAAWTWGDGSAAQSGTVSEAGGSGTAKGSHTFSAAGIYPVAVTVADNGGLTGSVNRNVVVYDPSAGFVTGNGAIRSPMGAFKADPTAAGNATFSFVSKYQKGAKVPVGTTAFQFQSAALDFYSDSYDWMVVSGARTQFKGIGTLDGAADYKFLLTAIDGQVTGGGGTDRFRIKIWHYDAALQQDVVDYDNQLDASTEGTLSEGTAIANGSIVIHTPNK